MSILAPPPQSGEHADPVDALVLARIQPQAPPRLRGRHVAREVSVLAGLRRAFAPGSHGKRAAR